MSVTVEEMSFEAWRDCLSVSNGVVDLVVTTGVGPRVLFCGFAGGTNLFYTDPERATLPGGFTLHGGHRLWHAPEDRQRTYVPDDQPVEWEVSDRGVSLRAPREESTGIRKRLSLSLVADAPVVEVDHELRNEGVWPVTLAPWPITMLEAGGRAVVPLTPGDPDALLPDRSLSLWPYASLTDDRLSLAEDAVFVDQDDSVDRRFKLGATGADEWAGYVVAGTGFVKTFDYDDAATYPDRDAAVEVYTDESTLELETLGPLVELAPDESVTHTETWRLVDDVGWETPAELVSSLSPR